MAHRSLREVLEEAARLEEQKRALLKQSGPILRQMRHATGQSQEDVAAGTGLSQTYLSMVENSKRTPTPETLRTIENFLRKEKHGDAKQAKEDARRARGN